MLTRGDKVDGPTKDDAIRTIQQTADLMVSLERQRDSLHKSGAQTELLSQEDRALILTHLSRISVYYG